MEGYQLVGSKWSWSHQQYDGQDIYAMAAAEGSQIRVTWRANGGVCCVCLFFASTWLLCKHLCSVLVTQRRETTFEVAQLRTRWSMGDAQLVVPLVNTTVKHLQKFSRLTGSAAHTTTPDIKLSLKKKIVYVKLKKGEKSDRTVVSECEKYNVVRAERMPLVHIMQQMPSHRFYDVFADLRGTMEAFKLKWHLKNPGVADAESSNDDADDAEFEEVHQFPPANIVTASAGTHYSWEREEDADGIEQGDVEMRDLQESEANPVPEVEQLHVEVDAAGNVPVPEHPISPPAWLNDGLSACCTSNPSQVSLPTMHFSETSQDLIAHTDTKTGKSSEELLEETERLVTRADAAVDGLDVLKLPAASTARAKSKSGIKRAVVEAQSYCSVTLMEFVRWMATTSDLSNVGMIASKYPVCYRQHFLISRIPTVLQKRMDMVCNDANFVIPWKLVQRVNSELLHWTEQKSYEENMDPERDEVIPAAFVASDMGGFSMRFVRLVLEYYALNTDIDEYKRDLVWVQQDWGAVGSMKQPFLGKITDPPDVLAGKLFTESPFSRKFTMTSGLGGRVQSSFRQIIGKLARQKQLNDAVMDLALSYVSKYCSCSYVIDSVSVADERTRVPDQKLSSCKFVVVPVHMNALKHWMIQVVEIQMSGTDSVKHKIWATFYDPLGLTSNLEICQAKWITFTLPLLQRWFARDVERIRSPNSTLEWQKTGKTSMEVTIKPAGQHTMTATKPPEFPNVVAVMMTRPKQTDAVSCGVLYIAQAYSYISGSRSLKGCKTMSEDDLAHMRLRLLWTLLHDSKISDASKGSELVEMVDVRKRVGKAFRSD